MSTEWYCPNCGPNAVMRKDTGKCATPDCRCSLQEDVPPFVTAMREEIAELRLALFYAHGGMQHLIYGDDGEQQCSTCMIDFKRDPPEEIIERLRRALVKENTEIEQEEGK